ncbi:hypothetical protein [Glutamicibacter sp.]|uniref:hypothetical protein n=1 Tax=Glutamicibacter sp. TaxID=1931995 RepID=UPI003D6C215E
MKSKVLATIILGAAAILLVVALAMDLGGTKPTAGQQPAATPDPVATSTAGQPTAGPETAEAAKPSGEAKKESAPEQSAPKPKATRPSWDPQPSATESRLEVPEAAKPSQFALPDTPKREPVLEKAPKSSVAEGKLVKGFPKAAVPVPESTSIVQSSVQNQAKKVLVGVEGRSSDSVDEVLAFYAKHFEELNWLTTQSAPAEGTTQLSGSYGAESATVTVRQLPTGATSIVAAGIFEVQE